MLGSSGGYSFRVDCGILGDPPPRPLAQMSAPAVGRALGLPRRRRKGWHRGERDCLLEDWAPSMAGCLGELPAPPEYTQDAPATGDRRDLWGRDKVACATRPLPGNPDRKRAAGQRGEPAEGVAVQVDHPAAAAGAPSRSAAHVDAAARPANGHGPAAPVAHAERRTGRGVQAARVRVMAHADAESLRSTSWQFRAPIARRRHRPRSRGPASAWASLSARTPPEPAGPVRPAARTSDAAPGSRRS